MGSHSGGLLCRQGVGATVPARMPRGASVDGALGRRALGLEIIGKIWYFKNTKKEQLSHIRGGICDFLWLWQSDNGNRRE